MTCVVYYLLCFALIVCCLVGSLGSSVVSCCVLFVGFCSLCIVRCFICLFFVGYCALLGACCCLTLFGCCLLTVVRCHYIFAIGFV